MRWFLGAALLLALGIIFELGLLVYAMYVLLGIMLLSRFLAHRWIDSVTAERDSSRLTAEIGDKVAVVITLRNTGWMPVPWLLLEDSVPSDALLGRRIKVEGKRLNILQIAGRGTKSLRYQVNFLMRGYYQIGPLLLETGDLFGLHRRYHVVTEPHFVLVFPRVIPLIGYDISSRRPIGEVRMTYRLFEDPTRISGVRQYQNGDPLNRVHWRATARTGVLHSKTYEPSTVAGATVLLDFHRDGYPARSEPQGSELAVTAAASLANALFTMGQQIGLVTNGRDAADRILQEGWKHDFRSRTAARQTVAMLPTSDRLRPVTVDTRRGADQLHQILETLARVELTDGLTLAELVLETSARLPRDATIVAIVPQVSPEAALALGGLRRRGFAVTVVLVMHDDDLYAESAGRLIAAGADVLRIEDEAAVSSFCSRQMVR